METAPLYGIILPDNDVQIVDQRDTTTPPLPRLCATINKADLIDLLWYCNVDPPNPEIADRSPPNVVNDEIARWFSPEEAADFTPEELHYAYSWARLPRQQICQSLIEALDNLNLLSYA